MNTEGPRVAVALSMLTMAGAPTLRAAGPVESWLTTADLRQALAPQPRSPSARSLPLPMTASRSTRRRASRRCSAGILARAGHLLELLADGRGRPRGADGTGGRSRQGIGMNLMRICIGTPTSRPPWYSYCDLPPGETDPELRRFSIERDARYILPVLQLARRKNPDLLFFASPWSPPGG